MHRVLVLVLGLFLISFNFASTSAQGANPSSRENPLPIGSTFMLGDYEVTVLDVDPDAEDVVVEASNINEGAPAGDVMVLVTVEVTYLGNETGSPAFELMYKAVGSENRGYSPNDKDCGYLPTGGHSVGELFTDGTAEYNLCWMVSEEEAPTLIMYVESLGSSRDETTVWISLDPNQVSATPQA